MKTTRIKAVVGSLLVTGAVLAALAPPVQAAGTGAEIPLDKMSSRSVTGGGNYVIMGTSTAASLVAPVSEGSASITTAQAADADAQTVPTTKPVSLVVEFECHATAGRDATQTRIVPGGCTLYKGGTAVGYAPGQSLPGPSAATQSTAYVDLWVPGEFVLCWDVSATYLLNRGTELFDSGCTQ
jgi:hypothetical protein